MKKVIFMGVLGLFLLGSCNSKSGDSHEGHNHETEEHNHGGHDHEGHDHEHEGHNHEHEEQENHAGGSDEIILPPAKAEAAGEVVRMVRDACKKPLMVKLSPQAENIPEMCKAVEAAGADAISLTNTFQACAIDLEKRRPVFDNIFAGLSGPAVRPIALRMVWQAVGAVNIPVVGLGGIATGKDALEFIMAGATAVQVGAANFANPRAMETIAEEMAAWMDAHGVKTLDEIRGCAR